MSPLLKLLLVVAGAAAAPTPADCEDAEFHMDPDNCPEGYFRCTPDGQGGWNIQSFTCDPGTAFNPELQMCDWVGDWTDSVCDGVTHGPTQPTQPTKPTSTQPPPKGGKRLVCYYSSWAFYRTGDGMFDIPDIDPHLCTHLNYGFANMDNSSWNIVAYDPWFDLAETDVGCDGDHCKYDSYRRFNQLKEKNPDLKTALSIGGWNSGSRQWSDMASDPARRKIFIESSVAFTKTFGFDGIDFDWEYPGALGNDQEGGGHSEDRAHFTALCQEFGAALHKEGKTFSAAMSADPKTAAAGYDIPALLEAFDWFNVMDYDYHGGWENFTGHNTPLFGRHEEDPEGVPGHNFNLNDSIHYYIEAGMPREKIVVGMATFGHGWQLPNSEETGLYCPAIAPSPPGPYSGQPGFFNYYEILQMFHNDSLPWLPGAAPHQWSTTVDGCYLAPYTQNGPYWVGYDDPDSIRLKAQWVNSMELGGAMVWTIEADDWRGDFGVAHPLIGEIRRVLNTGETLDPEFVLEEEDQCETAPSCPH